MRSITRSRRQPGNEAIGTRVIHSECEEAAAASMLGTPMKPAGDGYKFSRAGLVSPYITSFADSVKYTLLQI